MARQIQLDLKKLRQPRVAIRAVLGLLVLADLTAAALVFKPWAPSLEDMRQQAVSLQHQIESKQKELEHLRSLVKKVRNARSDGDQFMAKYLLTRATVASTLLSELNQTAQNAGVKLKETSTSYEPVEGYEALTKANITATCEGTYADLIHYLNLLDRSPRFLVIDTLSASPQQTGLTLGITMRLNAFVREGGPLPPQALASQGQAPPPHPQVAANGGASR